MDKVVPSLWFADNNCDEAIHYYLKVFPDSTLDAVTYYPDEKLDAHFDGMTGKILTAEFHLNGQKFLALRVIGRLRPGAMPGTGSSVGWGGEQRCSVIARGWWQAGWSRRAGSCPCRLPAAVLAPCWLLSLGVLEPV